MEYPYVLTQESLTVTVGANTHTIRKESPNFKTLVNALMNEDDEQIVAALSLCGVVRDWFAQFPEIRVQGESIFYKDVEVPKDISSRVHQMIAEGENPSPLIRFWERLSRNSSWRSTQQCYAFLAHNNLPISHTGKILAYKAVKSDWTDCHSGTIQNRVNSVIRMPRNQISDDPQVPCHVGLHVGALEYAKGFGGANSILLVCEVDPEHVVCVPYDCDSQKMRVCEYTVKGVVGTEMNDTVEDIDQELGSLENAPSEPKVTLVPKDNVEISLYGDVSETSTLSRDSLAEMSLDQLRKYASGTLKIVGASKIPGGKPALISRILAVQS